ncbi:MAG TPA: substrate-binding domain-containing protein [Capsulimonadaceae bacterium]|jgi:DNA-binding LacI/PurR family transcriptional regulator
MAKLDKISELLRTRILRGDYTLTGFPPIMQLAEEIGASRTTVRAATVALMELGLLEREATGRLVVTKELGGERRLHIGFLSPGANAADASLAEHIERILAERHGQLRKITFFHWTDPVLLNAIDNFDGVFVIPPAEALPEDVAMKLRAANSRIVMIGDFAPLGLHSVNFAPVTSIRLLLDHLGELGHRHISFFNTQPMDPIIHKRLGLWESWLEEHGCTGELVNEPEPSYGLPLERAYAVAKDLLETGVGFGGTAILCTSMPAYVGLQRAMYEHSLVVGRDMAVCCAFDEGMAPYMCPSLTSVRMATPDKLLRASVEWMAGGEWLGSLLCLWQSATLFVGESTMIAPATLPEYLSVRLAPVQFSHEQRNRVTGQQSIKIRESSACNSSSVDFQTI